MEYLYIILPGYQGRGEAPGFAQHAAKHGAAVECADGGHVCLFRMSLEDAHRMPIDQGDHYLGNDDSGHRLHPVNDELVLHFIPSPIWKHL